MTYKILINAVDPEECRIAVVKENKLDEFHIESAAREITHGNIYKGIVTRVEPSLQAAFIDYGAERHGFLQIQEIHHDYFQENHSRDRSIEHVVKKGQELLVQVVKDPIGKKGAMLTTFISLPGRYIVLMPGSKNRGISRKIEDEEKRQNLKDIIEKLKIDDDYGVIVRTVGENCTKTQISKDLRYLMRMWKNIAKKSTKAEAPTLMYKERNLSVRSIRDYLTPEISEILIDDPSIFREVKEFVSLISPRSSNIVKLFKGAKPIFTKYQLESQIASIFESRVNLKSGGSIVIEQTEALVAIDVNSGKGTRERSIEKTALMTNLDAAEEIARQLRLRDMGGLIVIDFIDMREPKNRAQIERTLREHMRTDRARSKVGRLSRFGLLEMNRQRLRPSIEFVNFHTCPQCQGKGLVPSTEMLALSFLRRLRLETLKPETHKVTGVLPVEVADYLQNRKRKEILDLEQRRDLSIRIEGDRRMGPGDSRINRG